MASARVALGGLWVVSAFVLGSACGRTPLADGDLIGNDGRGGPNAPTAGRSGRGQWRGQQRGQRPGRPMVQPSAVGPTGRTPAPAAVRPAERRHRPPAGRADTAGPAGTGGVAGRAGAGGRGASAARRQGAVRAARPARWRRRRRSRPAGPAQSATLRGRRADRADDRPRRPFGRGAGWLESAPTLMFDDRNLPRFGGRRLHRRCARAIWRCGGRSRASTRTSEGGEFYFYALSSDTVLAVAHGETDASRLMYTDDVVGPVPVGEVVVWRHLPSDRYLALRVEAAVRDRQRAARAVRRDRRELGLRSAREPRSSRSSLANVSAKVWQGRADRRTLHGSGRADPHDHDAAPARALHHARVVLVPRHLAPARVLGRLLDGLVGARGTGAARGAAGREQRANEQQRGSEPLHVSDDTRGGDWKRPTQRWGWGGRGRGHGHGQRARGGGGGCLGLAVSGPYAVRRGRPLRGCGRGGSPALRRRASRSSRSTRRLQRGDVVVVSRRLDLELAAVAQFAAAGRAGARAARRADRAGEAEAHAPARGRSPTASGPLLIARPASMNTTWSQIASRSVSTCELTTRLRAAVALRAQHVAHRGHQVRVEAARRLVEQHELGIAEQRLRHRHAPAHAVRELADARAGAIRAAPADRARARLRAARGRARKALQLGEVAQQARRRARGPGSSASCGNSPSTARLARGVEAAAPEHVDAARVGLEQAAHDAEAGGLARAVGADRAR